VSASEEIGRKLARFTLGFLFSAGGERVTLDYLLYFPNLFEWTKVRAFSNLEILRKISYFIIVLVPILATIWHKISESLALDENLPIFWVVSFFSSLSVIVSHTIFELFAPIIIKEFSPRDYLDHKIRDFRDNETVSKIDHAIEHVAAYRDLEVEDLMRSIRSIEEKFPLIEIEEDYKKAILIKGEERVGILSARKLAIIDEASKIEYSYQSGLNSFFAFISSILYITAIVGIFWIFFTQSQNVLNAAGVELF